MLRVTDGTVEVTWSRTNQLPPSITGEAAPTSDMLGKEKKDDKLDRVVIDGECAGKREVNDAQTIENVAAVESFSSGNSGRMSDQQQSPTVPDDDDDHDDCTRDDDDDDDARNGHNSTPSHTPLSDAHQDVLSAAAEPMPQSASGSGACGPIICRLFVYFFCVLSLRQSTHVHFFFWKTFCAIICLLSFFLIMNLRRVYYHHTDSAAVVVSREEKRRRSIHAAKHLTTREKRVAGGVSRSVVASYVNSYSLFFLSGIAHLT